MKKIFFDELQNTFYEILVKNNFSIKRAELCANIFAENTLCGVASHGVNRFPAFIKLVRSRHINPNAEPEKISSFGAWEQWDGKKGAGPLNAWFITDKVIELSKQTGVGVISLKNTNHWMRPGVYGWKAAEKGHILICWTNTIPIMPAWNGTVPTIGNNPMTIAVPRNNGHVVLDMALSQYAYGKLQNYNRDEKELPYPGGFDKNGDLTNDAAKILESNRPLPMGYWKGSGLSILLDLLATILSGGQSTHELGKMDEDSGMSQIYIAFDPAKSLSADMINDLADNIISSIREENFSDEKKNIYYPGERVKFTREKNLKEGILIHPKIWEEIEKL